MHEVAGSEPGLWLQLNSTIPVAWGANGTMPKLSTVVLYTNDDLRGTVPAGFATMPLVRLDVNNTQVCSPGTAMSTAGSTASYVDTITSQLPSCE